MFVGAQSARIYYCPLFALLLFPFHCHKIFFLSWPSFPRISQESGGNGFFRNKTFAKRCKEEEEKCLPVQFRANSQKKYGRRLTRFPSTPFLLVEEKENHSFPAEGPPPGIRNLILKGETIEIMCGGMASSICMIVNARRRFALLPLDRSSLAFLASPPSSQPQKWCTSMIPLPPPSPSPKPNQLFYP